MRIGIVLATTPGYSETFFNSKIKGLQRNGMDVRLYCQSKKTDFSLCPVILRPKISRNPLFQFWYFLKEYFLLLLHVTVVFRFIKLELNDGTSFFNILKKVYLNAHLLKAKLDWLHFGFATQTLGSETAAKAIGAKMAVSFRGFDINVYPIKHPGCYKTLWKHVDKVHSISQYLLNKSIEMGLSPETSTAIISPAVDLEKLPKFNMSANAKQLKIVTIARLTWIKGLDVAMAAMQKLKHKEISFTYYIIGEGNKTQTERYKFMVYELGLKNEVVFCGKLSHQETLEHLLDADLYVQPSINEGFCNAVLEAQAMGKLTIASNTGGLPENILNGKTGWLFENMSAEDLAQKIEVVLALSKEEKALISENAKKRVVEVFTVQKQQLEFLHFYNGK
jgi:colanic acid/amylovoran biosynthesis glycosyltransferase